MFSIRSTFLAAAVAAAPSVLAPASADASTVTGALTIGASGFAAGFVADDRSWSLSGVGTLNAVGGLSDYLTPAHDWRADGHIRAVGIGTFSDTETFGSSVSGLGLIGEILPYEPEKFLFTLFANAVVLIYEAVGLGEGEELTGSYVFGGGWGLLPAGDRLDWTVSSLAGTAGPGEDGIDLEGTFDFTLSGSNVDETIGTVWEFFMGTALPPEFDISGIPPVFEFETRITVSPLPIPLPGALPLLAGGFAVLGFVGWRRRAS